MAPRRGAMATASPQQGANENDQPVGHQQDLTVPLSTNANEHQMAPQHSVIPAEAIP